MTNKLNQLTAGACSLLVASFAVMAPSSAQFEDAIDETTKEQIDNAFADCAVGMQASATVDIGRGYSEYTCSFEGELICPASAPCAATVQHCRPGFQYSDWNTKTLASPARGTPDLEFVTGYFCRGQD